ncbi:MAG: DUF5777 family beta-barrel protein [Putridiphycobacter sp.]|nr:DUF5777 family beta-barrel protein [Putridiphycobacter sp.]
MKKWVKILVLFFALGQVQNATAQDDLLDLLESESEPVTNYTFATFKGTKLVSGHSIETNGKGVLQFLIGHRFGRINSGISDLFGIDNATIRLGFEYGITDQLNIGFGRSSYLKTYDGTVKWKFLRQKSGAENFPFTATLVSQGFIDTTPWSDPERQNFFSSRLAYTHSLLLARKFNNYLSLQLMPAIAHRNIVPLKKDNNTIVAVGAGGSVKLTGSLRVNVEYYYIPENQIFSLVNGETVKNPLSIGVDLETGGHVFQLHLTNSRGMTEKFLLGETTGSWLNGDIHFGFNVSRVFTVKKPKEYEKI